MEVVAIAAALEFVQVTTVITGQKAVKVKTVVARPKVMQNVVG